MTIQLRNPSHRDRLALTDPGLAPDGLGRASPAARGEKSELPWDLRWVKRIRNFMKDVTEPGPLLALALAAPAFSLTRNSVMAWLLERPMGFWTRSLGLRIASATAALPFEVLTYSGTERAYRAIQPPTKSLEVHPSTLLGEWGALALTFGLFKVHGRLAQSLFPAAAPRALISAAGMYTGLLHSQLWEHQLGGHPIQSWEGFFLDAAKTLVKLKTMGQLSHQWMGARYGAWVASLEARAEQKILQGQSDFFAKKWAPAGMGAGLWAMSMGKTGETEPPDAAAPLSQPPESRNTGLFVGKMLKCGWSAKQTLSFHHFISQFFSRPENQTGIHYPMTISLQEIRDKIPLILPSLAAIQMAPEQQVSFLQEAFLNHRYYSLEFLETIPRVVQALRKEGKSSVEILEFFAEMHKISAHTLQFYDEGMPPILMGLETGMDLAHRYIQKTLPSSIPPAPPAPEIRFIDPAEAVPAPREPLWEPIEARKNSWYYSLGFWHYQMPIDLHEVTVGRDNGDILVEGELRLKDLGPRSKVAVEHAKIRRFVTKDDQNSYVITAQGGDVVLRCFTKSVKLKGSLPDPDMGENAWLMPGDIVQLAPDVEFIFDPIPWKGNPKAI